MLSDQTKNRLLSNVSISFGSLGIFEYDKPKELIPKLEKQSFSNLLKSSNRISSKKILNKLSLNDQDCKSLLMNYTKELDSNASKSIIQGKITNIESFEVFKVIYQFILLLRVNYIGPIKYKLETFNETRR